MNFKSFTLALLAGIASFLVVGIAVTAFLETWIEFSLFVGLPMGLVAGAAVAGTVYLGLADDIPSQDRRVAFAFGTFGIGFLGAMAIAVVAGSPLTLSIGVGLIVGIAAALGGYLLGPKTPPVTSA